MESEKTNKLPGSLGSEEGSREHEVRVKKAKKLHEQGVGAWPAYEPVNATCTQVIEEYGEGEEPHEYAIAGRIMSIRLHGKTAFAHIQDWSGRLQIYIREDLVGDTAFTFFEQFIDIGDIIWVVGSPFKTKTGEITLKAKKLKLLSKCLHPLPEKFHGLVDIETIYRQRYLDLLTNPESRERFLKRSALITSMRSYFDQHGFIEVETPLLHPIAGGAVARPFITHHHAHDMDLYLRIAPELYLKRLIIGGFERVYEIGRCFRNEGISTKHNPEFTMAEFYIAYQDYHFMMDFIEKMLKTITKEINDSLQLPFGDITVDLSKPFTRLSMKDAVKQYTSLTDRDLTPENIDETIRKKGLEVSKKASWGKKLSLLFEELVESKIEQPTFIIGFPIEVSPLAKRDPENQNIAARFELFIAGMEIGNGFNELNDPFDQAQRFREQAALKAEGDEEAHYYDADYILALEYGLPPTVGAGIGIDRLTMLITNKASIRDVILFPTLKKKRE
jgi:lysyl-tRNA synthetase class 2